MEFKETIEKRYATKAFTGEKINQSTIEKLQKYIQLSASSFGLQPYTIYVVTDDEKKKELLPAAFNQEQITSCSHLLVFCANNDVKKRIDTYESMLASGKELTEGQKQYIEMMRYALEQRTDEDLTNWAAKQAYLALANAINGAKDLGLDSCPMEGFDAKEFHRILNMPANLTPVVLCPIGIAKDTPLGKLRYPVETLFVES